MSYSDSPCNSCFGAGTTRTKFQSPKKYKDTQKVWLEQINGRFVDDMKWLLDVIEGRIRLLATDDSTRR